MVNLAACEDTLALFTEGIAGRYLHIKATDEFANNRQLAYHNDRAGQGSDALFLPEEIDAPDHHCYRVLVLEQIGLRECGTFSFRMQRGLAEISELASRYEVPKGATPRTGDFFLLFSAFAQPSLASELFNLFEKARVQAHLLRTYPGINRHMQRYHQHLLATAELHYDPLSFGHRSLWGDDEIPPEWRSLGDALQQLQGPDQSVYDSVRALCQLYDQVAEAYVFDNLTAYPSPEESIPDWLNREQRIDEWDEKLEELDDQVMMADMIHAEDLEAERGETSEAAVRDAEVDIKMLMDERDTLKRRIDMEKSSVQHALGADRSAARSYRYDEWDYLQRRYLTHWCRVYEESLSGTDEEDIEGLNNAIRHFQGIVQKQLEQIRPTGLQRISRVQDGDELDLNAIIEARQDIRAGQSPSERFYSRKERMHRDVCAIFLVDLSASTDDPVEPPEPKDWSDYDEDAADNMRDPWYASLSSDEEEPVVERKIIDIQREAMVVMASALDALGDSYGIYGFSGYGKDCVEVFVAKEPQEGFSQRTLQSIAAMKPKRSTRMGPAIRHSTHKLMQSGHAMKVLMIISDGFPQDSDYGPERGNHTYGVEDTAKAIKEAQQKGVETFCITVDRSGQDYLKQMCPDSRYLVIEEMEDLPDQLTKVYAALTGR
ncbi:MAG: VWA domain-containing protein [Pseudomonadaceae bacterium]|nr:VWA domain-containing protein [Pseudomonadaceae bacterium]